jgi:AcrR family transcriptional regulator
MSPVIRYDVKMTRTLRADAERNRQRLLDAAAELFADKGLSVGLDEIARHAGVGVATAYRRFPDKAELIDALFEDRLDRLVALAEDGLAADDPWAGLVGFMEGAVEVHASNRGVKELMFSGGYAAAFVGRAQLRLSPLVDELVRRAQASGDLRADVEFTDMPLIQFLVSGVGELGGPHTPGLWRRFLAIVLDGLRTPEPRPLPVPALSMQAFAETIAATTRER